MGRGRGLCLFRGGRLPVCGLGIGEGAGSKRGGLPGRGGGGGRGGIGLGVGRSGIFWERRQLLWFGEGGNRGGGGRSCFGRG